MNNAAFLIIDGGVHNGFNIDGIGEAKARKLFYRVLTGYLGPSSGLKNAANSAGS